MQTDIQEIYQNTILPLTEKDQLKLASMILKKVRGEENLQQSKQKNGGDISKLFGSFDSGDADSADNEKIDADLARAYADDHEDLN